MESCLQCALALVVGICPCLHWIVSRLTHALGTGGAGGDRNLNYSIGAVRDWYAKEQEPLLHAGVDFWWNDEGMLTYGVLQRSCHACL